MKETMIQFGTGNFLRGFIEPFLQILQEKGLYDGKIVIVQPTKGGKVQLLNAQQGSYHLFLRGIQNGKEICELMKIQSVSRGVDPYSDFDSYLALAENPDMRFIVSNTTEAGIRFDENCAFSDKPALSFPGKLTQLLYHRFQCNLGGFILLPCELIDDNGDNLKKTVLRYAKIWQLGKDFEDWIQRENQFCNTLVDRIVTGYPKNEAKELIEKIGFDDPLLDTAEIFHLWVIEGNFEKELPLQKSGIHVIWTDDVTPYKKMKVRILNGAHTALVFPSLLCQIETVGESLKDEMLRKYLDFCLYQNILPALGETEEHLAFAAAVLERFQNPYIQHLWKSISLNSVSKFRTRVLPSIDDYIEKKKMLPKSLIFSLSCLLAYYKKNEVADEPKAVELIKNSGIDAILSNTELWGKDLTFCKDLVTEGMERIQNQGIRQAIVWAMEK